MSWAGSERLVNAKATPLRRPSLSLVMKSAHCLTGRGVCSALGRCGDRCGDGRRPGFEAEQGAGDCW